MIICRTEKVSKLSSNFIKAKPLAVIQWVVLALVMVAIMVIGIINVGSSSREIFGWIILSAMVGFMVLMLTSVARSDNEFNAFVVLDDGKIIFINFGNIFMNSKLFGEPYKFSHSKIRICVEWFKAAKRMKGYSNGEVLDAFAASNAVLGAGHYVERTFSVKSSNKYIIAKLRLKKCRTIEGELFTEFTKTIRIPKDFENAELLENELRAAAD
ncbi:MAG: hypothetical protein NC485_01605 [Ruminococcus flavefaciens]|nr:hypothetical protein [Ruminococcus flavefaciens]MCM1058703.1 hypothetical protein [Eubacterium sp.]